MPIKIPCHTTVYYNKPVVMEKISGGYMDAN